MKKLFALEFIMILFISCNSKTEYQTIKIKNKYSVELPDFLSEVTTLNEGASLQYQNPLREFYVIVLEEPKSEFPDQKSVNLETYKAILRDGLQSNLTNPKFYQDRDTVINGLKAKLFSLSDTSDNIAIYYQFAYLESKNNFYQVLTWTLENRKEQFSKDMTKIIASFKEIESREK
ncbi:hypothetical protein [Flavobacterium soli]|uniref:hypothetical protein n=1 Tax=Flavobacterium soli TaxID=344881 RepID=UPI000419E4CF|nr:hypothetical protein [Flavobacterium soli]